MISDLNPYRLFPQYWLLTRNDPDALISAFPVIMIATGLNVPESLLSIIMINYHSPSGKWLTFIPIVQAFVFKSRHGRSFVTHFNFL